MNSSRLFLIQIVVLITLVMLWVLFVQEPRALEQQELNLAMDKMVNVVRDLQVATEGIDSAVVELEDARQAYRQLAAGLVQPDNFPAFAAAFKELAQAYKVHLEEFAPNLTPILSDTLKAPVYPIELRMTLAGTYLGIGRFLEAWKTFDTHLVPVNLTIYKPEDGQQNLHAAVLAEFYVLNSTGNPL